MCEMTHVSSKSCHRWPTGSYKNESAELCVLEKRSKKKRKDLKELTVANLMSISRRHTKRVGYQNLEKWMPLK